METHVAARPLRVAVVGPQIGRNPGQVTTQGEIIADRLMEAGHSVVELSPHLSRAKRMLHVLSGLFRHRREVDVVYLQMFSGPSMIFQDLASLIARWLGLPISMVMHGGDLPNMFTSKTAWCRKVIARAGSIAAPSEYNARAVRDLGFACTVIPNVINLQNYPYRLRRELKPNLYWMRSFHSIYEPHVALEAASIVLASHPDLKLVMGGNDKGELEATRKRAAELGLADKVEFPGFLDMAAKARWGSWADIFLNTNRVDNMPVAVVEACAMGLPVVATAAGGVPDLLTHEETGLLTPVGDSRAMAEAVMRLLGEGPLAERLSFNARELAVRSDWPAVYPALLKLFEAARADARQLKPARGIAP